MALAQSLPLKLQEVARAEEDGSSVWQSHLTHIPLEALSIVLHYLSYPPTPLLCLLCATSSPEGRDSWGGGAEDPWGGWSPQTFSLPVENRKVPSCLLDMMNTHYTRYTDQQGQLKAGTWMLGS